MTPDDSLLSAYLDDELDAAARLSFESDLLARPELGERLQELAAVRGLVFNLARPTVAYDLSGPVLEQIRARPLYRVRRAVARPRSLTAGTLVALAATLLLAVGPYLIGAARHARPRPGLGHGQPSVATARVRPPAPVAPRIVAREVGHAAVAHPAPLPPPPPLAASELASVRDRARLRGLLDRPGARRLTLVLDSLDNAALGKVETAIDRTRRRDPVRAKLHVGQAIAVDPTRPNEAVVYLLVLNDDEQAQLAEQMREQFPGLPKRDYELQDTPAPAVLAKLGEVGELEIGDHPPRPLLASPPESIRSELAKRDDPAGTVIRVDPESSGVPEPARRPAGEPEEVADMPGDQAPPASSRHTRGTICLVWVTTGHHGQEMPGRP